MYLRFWRTELGIPGPTSLRVAFPVFRLTVELLIGAVFLLSLPAAVYSLALDSPDVGTLNASALRISLVLTLGLSLCIDALYLGKRLRVNRTA
ncbi:MAG: hypothetical protein ACRYFU_00060 [Janthinobacterium lividum]